MAIGLYVDVHVHGGIVAGLRARGVDVLTAQQDRRDEAADRLLLLRATELGRVLVSAGRDMLVLAAERQRAGTVFSGLAYVHPLRVTLSQAIAGLELIAKVLEPDEMKNVVLHLPL